MSQEIWILSHSGEDLYHFSSHPNIDDRKALLNSFLSSLHQIASDMGDSKSYHVENDNCIIIGKAISLKLNDSAYLIGKFNRSKQINLKKCQSILNSFVREFRNYNLSDKTEIEKIKEKITEFLKKEKI